MEKEKSLVQKSSKKKVIVDWLAAAIVLIGLVVCYFFWGCSYDLPVTILAAIIVVAGTTLVQIQNKKINEANKLA